LSLLLLLLVVGDLNGNGLRDADGRFLSISRATFDVNLSDVSGQNSRSAPHLRKLDIGFGGLTGRDLLQDEGLGAYSSNAIVALSPFSPSQLAQPIMQNDPTNQTRIGGGAGTPSQLNRASSEIRQTMGPRQTPIAGVFAAKGTTAIGVNDIGAIAARDISGSDVFTEGLTAKDRRHADSAGTGRQVNVLADVVIGNGEPLFCDGCSSMPDGILLAKTFGAMNVNDLLPSSDPLQSSQLDSAFAINDRGVSLGSTGCGLDTPEVCQTDLTSLMTKVPEPGTLSLLGAGLLALGLMRRRSAISI
jgi:hypothetical protein